MELCSIFLITFRFRSWSVFQQKQLSLKKCSEESHNPFRSRADTSLWFYGFSLSWQDFINAIISCDSTVLCVSSPSIYHRDDATYIHLDTEAQPILSQWSLWGLEEEVPLLFFKVPRSNVHIFVKTRTSNERFSIPVRFDGSLLITCH